MRVIRKSLAGTLLLCLCFGAEAREFSGIDPAARETLLGSALWLHSSNSAGLALDSLGRMSSLSLEAFHEQGGLKSVWSGERENDIRVAVDGITEAGGMTLYGDFSYDYISQSGVEYNASLYEPSYDQPYFVADYSVSDWKKQAYDMGFRAASPLFWNGRAAFGFEARYKALVGAKQIDPRTETFRYDISLAPSVAVRLGEHSSLGLGLEYLHSFERSRPSVENDWVTPRVAIMRGLGFYTAGTAGGNLGFDIFYYKKDQFGASMQYMLDSGSADLLVDAGATYSVTPVTENPELPRMRGRTEKLAFSLKVLGNFGKKKNHRIRLSADWGSTSGYEYNQQLDNSPGASRWVTISNPLMSTYDILEAGASYVWYAGLDGVGEYDFKAGVNADMFLMMQEYVVPLSRFNAVNAAAHVFAGWNLRLGAGRLLPSLSVGYRVSPSGEYLYSGSSNTDSVIVTDMYPSELRFLTADRLESGAGVTWAFGIGDASTLSVRLAGGYDHSFSIGEHRLRANLGIQYLF